MGWESECIIFKSLQEFNDWKNEIADIRRLQRSCESQFTIDNKGEKLYDYIYIRDEITNEKYKLMFISHPDASTDYSVLVELS